MLMRSSMMKNVRKKIKKSYKKKHLTNKGKCAIINTTNKERNKQNVKQNNNKNWWY